MPFFERHVTTPHSVVIALLIDEADQPAIAARRNSGGFHWPARCRTQVLVTPTAAMARDADLLAFVAVDPGHP